MSLADRLNQLESDLVARPPRISAYSELPCALFQYPHDAEWEFRRELNKLRTRVQNSGKNAYLVSLAEIMWQAIDQIEGLDPVADLEVQSGWTAAQDQLRVYLSDPDFTPLPRHIADYASQLDPNREVIFLWRAASLAPGIYLLSKLLDELKGMLNVPTVLFYPGAFDEGGLRFMGLDGRETSTNYRAKIYH